MISLYSYVSAKSIAQLKGNKMKSLKVALVALALVAMTGCTRINSGQVGVEKSFTGEYSKEPVDVGIHMTILRTLYAYSTREIPVKMENLRPTTKDNTSILSDLDVEVQYSVNSDKTPVLAVKYANMHGKSENDSSTTLPAYFLVEKQAKSVVADAVAKFDALEIASKRNELEDIIRKNLQSDLDKNDPGAFIVSRVTISNLLPDVKIQESIRAIAESANKKQVALNNLEIAKTQALENKVRSESLDGKILAEKQLEAMVKMGERGNVIIVPMDFKGMINIPANTSKKTVVSNEIDDELNKSKETTSTANQTSKDNVKSAEN